MNTVYKVPVLEYERGWGSKVDDHMICLSLDAAKTFQDEFNSENTELIVPDWYMQAKEPETMDITDKEFEFLKKEGQVWLSVLQKI